MNTATADTEYILNTYKRYPLNIKKSKGLYVYDTSGKAYLDFLSGISVCNLGHSHEKIIKALHEQLEELIHCSNLYYTENAIRLAQRLSQMSFRGKSFFTNSGTEANEAALKFMRYRGQLIDKNKTQILSLRGSFHGRSLGSLSLSGQEHLQKGFAPLVPDIHYIEANKITELDAHSNEHLAGIIIETIQGERGIHPLTDDFIKACRAATRKHNAILIIDEIQSGLGRTGRFLSYEHSGIEPDGYTIAKALGNGIPIGALHIHKDHADIFHPGTHGSTFGGNPFATRAALEVLDILESWVLTHSAKISPVLRGSLERLCTRYSFLKGIRGKGLMLALATDVNAQDIVHACLQEGLLVNGIREDTVRLLPPLIIQEEDIDAFYQKIARACARF